MVDVRPFSGLRYNSARLGVDLSAVTCPPYDVISAAERAALIERDSRNVVRLELPAAEDEHRYRAAARQLRIWRSDGTLVEDSEPAFYAYLVRFSTDGGSTQRRGVIAAMRLDADHPRLVRPHERTLPGPKQDRLDLMRACRANFSPIWCLYRDRRGATGAFWDHVESLEPAALAVDADGVEHALWAVTDAATVGPLRAALDGEPVYIADGHHRYETAIYFQREAQAGGVGSSDAAANFAMTYFVESSDPGLVVLGTHRLLRVPASRGSISSLVTEGLSAAFDLRRGPASPKELLAALAAADGRPGFAVWAPRAGLSEIALLRDDLVPTDAAYGHSEAWRRLDLAALHGSFMDRLCPEGAATLVDQGLLSYTRSLEEAKAAAARDERTIALLVRPTPVDQVMAVADAEDRMPEKSTYFFPKPVTGLVMASLSGSVPAPE